MHLHRRLIAALCIASFLLPIGAFAASKKATLREMLQIVQSNVRPVEYALKMSASYPGFAASLQLDGRGTGNVKHLKDVAADVKFSLAVDMNDSGMSGAGKLTGEFRIVNSLLYVYLDTFEVTDNNDIEDVAEEITPYLRKWISFPMDPEHYELGQQQARKTTPSLGRFERFFDIKTTEEQGRVRYRITLPEAKKRGLIQAIANQSRAYTKQRMDARTRKALNSILLTIDVTIEALADKKFESGKAGFNFQMTADGKPLKTSLEMSTNVSLFQAPIVAPAGSVSIDELSDGAFSPTKQLADARDAQRRSDINTILNANYQYAIDHNGKLPSTIKKGSVLSICKTSTPCAGVSLDALNEVYIVRTPVDPTQDASSPFTGYTIEWLSNDRLRVSAPMAEGGKEITVTR